MDKPLVSICCLTYNHEPYIRQCIEGFLMQETSFPFEILIHDDASTDNTARIIREYEQKFPNIIKPIYQTENQWSKGKKVSFEFQFPRAQGKYIAMCEGDDYWTDPLKLQKQADFLEQNPDYILTVGGYKSMDYRKNKKSEVILQIDNNTNNSGFNFSLIDMHKAWITKTLTLVFENNKEVLYRTNKYGTFTRDIQLIYELLKTGRKGYYFKEIFGVYNLHGFGEHSSNLGINNVKIAYEIYKDMYRINQDEFTRKKYFYSTYSLLSILPKHFVDGIAKSEKKDMKLELLKTAKSLKEYFLCLKIQVKR